MSAPFLWGIELAAHLPQSCREVLQECHWPWPLVHVVRQIHAAAFAAVCKPAAEAMKRLADDCVNFGSLHYDQWLAAYKGLRHAAAKMINGTPEEVAIVKNTSEGISTAILRNPSLGFACG